MEIQLTPETLKGKSLMVSTPMYGGQCFGSYMKSCLDLQSACMQYGVECRFSFLFNESLIQRARNYSSSEFMRSGCTHHIFIDSDVSFNAIDVIAMLAMDKEVIGGPYPKKCCPANTLIVTEDGVKKIKWIVDNEYTGKVLSFDINTKEPVWKNIISHSVETGDKQWVSIGRKGKKMLVVTDDHECAVVDNILDPSNIKYVQAKDSVGKYIIKEVNSSGKNSINPLYSQHQLEFLVGSLLGDGSIRKGYLGFGHSNLQREYIELKQSIFGGKLGNIKKVGSYKGKDYYASFLECPRNAQILKLEELLYTDSGIKCKKTVKNILNLITEKSLAFWYMDDGNLSYQYNGNPSVTLHTNSFSLEDLDLLVNMLKDKWNLDFSITKKNTLYLKPSSCDAFFTLISKYIIPNFKYKLPEVYNSNDNIFDYSSLKFLQYSAEYINQINYIDTKNKNIHFQPRKLYDIGIEDTHCFFGNGHLVHNCINWNNIKKAIMKNPDISADDLAGLGGDIVFNAVGGMSSFNVSELVEVMELGTGFMMIRRDVYEKYEKAYPHRMYKPDHANTFFDGSVEICSFWNVEKDPVSKRLWSEDYQFSHEVADLGIKVWMAPWIELQHTGSYVFQGSLPRVARYLGEL